MLNELVGNLPSKMLRQGIRHPSAKLVYWKLPGFVLHDSRSIYLSNAADNTTNLPVHVDLLEKYRALVALGHVQYNEEQVRVVMRVGMKC